jgi:hypothetical protein
VLPARPEQEERTVAAEQCARAQSARGKCRVTRTDRSEVGLDHSFLGAAARRCGTDSVDADFAAMVDSWGTVLPDAPTPAPRRTRQARRVSAGDFAVPVEDERSIAVEKQPAGAARPKAAGRQAAQGDMVTWQLFTLDRHAGFHSLVWVVDSYWRTISTTHLGVPVSGLDTLGAVANGNGATAGPVERRGDAAEGEGPAQVTWARTLRGG